ncbi:DUF2255 family protein [Streptomyces sp. NPDC050523]|uniref:DUF2255 family protein n=1 Tax=Streptomyces sp. NPDC050523 TaxID=3365622 RepID=UPI0037A7F2F8
MRSWRGGAAGTCWNTARSSRRGHISAGGVDADVVFTPVGDPAVNEREDGACRATYGCYSGQAEPMVAERARATTLRPTPRPPALNTPATAARQTSARRTPRPERPLPPTRPGAAAS